MTVTGTYRLQLHADFGFADAQAQLPYLARLGVSHLYLSPILQAAEGSMHGYDVVDHTRVSADLGGRDAFVALATAARELGLGVIVDVVPNHMAFVAPESVNVPLWLVLRDGRDAVTADWFDIDWKAGGGRLGLAILGDTLETVLAAGELTLDEIDDPANPGMTTRVIRYHEHVLPTALGSADAPDAAVRDVLDRQHYRLTSWRDKDDVLNYRRFFDVDQLIAVRVELDDVFDATHATLLELNHAGLIDGFRIDHPDGLADPAGYLARLRGATRKGTYIWVEKILEGTETLPADWQCEGTTGYDAARAISGALVDPVDTEVIEREWELSGGADTLATAVGDAKRQVVDNILLPEVERLTRRAREVLPELDPERLRAAVVELLVAGEVYRAYVRPEERLSAAARDRLAQAFALARANRPELTRELDELVALTVVADDENPPMVDFAVRLQQTWGPVMAKGIEDTTFYRYHRLVALNEVGGDPEALEHGSPGTLHRWAAHQQEHWPLGMTTLSTHDTKRSEDVRARIIAVAGDSAAWEACSRIARDEAATAGVDAPTAHLLWQTLLGVGEIAEERIDGYVMKAIREAKLHTAWVDGDSAYEERVLAFVGHVRDSGPLHDAISQALADNAEAIRATILAQKALQLTLPGVPDTYQGCELVDLSLVDPDNRRPVDYAGRRALLDSLDALGAPTAADPLDREKLHLTSALLRLRRELPDVFGEGASYAPLPTDTEHALGFVRSSQPGRLAGALGLAKSQSVLTVVTRAPARLRASGGWGRAVAVLPDGEPWLDVLTGSVHPAGPCDLARLFEAKPVAVLRR